jgi:hypothetical protein
MPKTAAKKQLLQMYRLTNNSLTCSRVEKRREKGSKVERKRETQ